jgi:hypothetical protein
MKLTIKQKEAYEQIHNTKAFYDKLFEIYNKNIDNIVESPQDIDLYKQFYISGFADSLIAFIDKKIDTSISNYSKIIKFNFFRLHNYIKKLKSFTKLSNIEETHMMTYLINSNSIPNLVIDILINSYIETIIIFINDI